MSLLPNPFLPNPILPNFAEFHFAEKNQQIGQGRDTLPSSAKWVSANCPIFIWLKVTWVKKLVIWLIFLSSVSRVLVTGTGRFGKDVSAKKIRDVSAYFFCRNVRRHVFAETSAAMFLPKRLLSKRPVPLSDMSPFPLVPRGPLGPLIFPSC